MNNVAKSNTAFRGRSKRHQISDNRQVNVGQRALCSAPPSLLSTQRRWNAGGQSELTACLQGRVVISEKLNDRLGRKIKQDYVANRFQSLLIWDNDVLRYLCES